MIEVELPDGVIAEFPDGMPPLHIEQALSAHYGTAQPPMAGHQSQPREMPQTPLGLRPSQIERTPTAPPPPEPEPMQSLTFDAIPEGLRVEVPDPAVPGGKRVSVARNEFKHITGRIEVFNRLMDCLAE